VANVRAVSVAIAALIPVSGVEIIAATVVTVVFFVGSVSIFSVPAMAVKSVTGSFRGESNNMLRKKLHYIGLRCDGGEGGDNLGDIGGLELMVDAESIDHFLSFFPGRPVVLHGTMSSFVQVKLIGRVFNFAMSPSEGRKGSDTTSDVQVSDRQENVDPIGHEGLV
jgi:hypothetical protein